MKTKKILLIGVSAIVAIVAVLCVVVLVKTKMPSRDYMDLGEYFGVTEGTTKIILQDTVYDGAGIVEDGQLYLDSTLVTDILNQRFYWDAHENLLLYTTSTAVITAELDSKNYTINKSKQEFEHTIVTLRNDTVYIAADYVGQYTAMSYELYENPDRAVITYKYGNEENRATTNDEVKLRYEADIKSDILVDLHENTELRLMGDVDDETGFVKVMTLDGITGYIKAKNLNEAYKYIPETDFKEETYTHTLMDETVNLVWHQVTNTTANDGLVSLLANTRNVNVVAPTWFATSDNVGNISSLASYSYVEKAHASGVQVWALCDDFSPDMKIGKVLGRTSRRQRLEKNLIAEAIRYNLDGINIDFENVKQESGDDFIQFIRELGIMCRNNGIILSIDNYPPADYSSYYNRSEQANVADYVITMAYDEYYSGSETAGPVSSLSYVQNSMNNTLAEVPAEQTIIALPFYSRLWAETTKDGKANLTAESYSMKFAREIVEDAGADIKWDDTTGLEYAEYKKNKTLYKIWIENAESIGLKLDAVSEGNVAGVAFWKLGLEETEVWNKVDKYLSGSKNK